MKILHLCLGNFYIDNYSYQENMLSKFHKEMGLDVEIIASLVSFDENGKQCLLEGARQYTNEYGIPVTRLEYKNLIFSKRLRIYKGTYKAIELAKPDIIFIHGCQFLDIYQVVKYIKNNPHVKVYVDNHADFSNSARNFFSKNILHKIIWRHCAQIIEPYTTKFYGVLPARVDFLKDIYKVPEEKVDLLVMGADDGKVEEAKNIDLIQQIREKHGIKPGDFLIVTGGKIDNAKRQTLLLMKAVKRIKKENVKLIVFGSIIEELKEQVMELVDNDKIQYIGWINAEDSYKYFASSNLVVFPGRHSVFWEQVAGLGIPMVVKYWSGTTHVDLGGNCLFLYKDTIDEIYKVLINIIEDKNLYKKMRDIAEKEGMKHFSYRMISSSAIELPIKNSQSEVI